jgi:hypothetical protein
VNGRWDLQLLGKIESRCCARVAALEVVRAWLARHSVDWYVMSEDLAKPTTV